MAKKKTFSFGPSLQEGLSSTVTAASSGAGALRVEMIALQKIELDPDNPRDLILNSSDLNGEVEKGDPQYDRKIKEKKELASMARSITDQGVINPIVVYQHGDCYRLVAGERRTLASILGNFTTIPAKILPEKPEPLKLSLLQWIENIEREDLSLWERIRNLDKIIAAYARSKSRATNEISAAELSELLHCSIQQGTNYRAIINATEVLKSYIEQGSIGNIEKAAFIARAKGELQTQLIEACLTGATLKQLKILSENYQNKKKSKREKGKRINFGGSTNPHVAKALIEAVLAKPEFSNIKDNIGEVKWDDPVQIHCAFKQLIKSLEKTIKEK